MSANAPSGLYAYMVLKKKTNHFKYHLHGKKDVLKFFMKNGKNLNINDSFFKQSDPGGGQGRLNH